MQTKPFIDPARANTTNALGEPSSHAEQMIDEIDARIRSELASGVRDPEISDTTWTGCSTYPLGFAQ